MTSDGQLDPTSTAQTHFWASRMGWIGFALGALAGTADFVVFSFLGIRIEIKGLNVAYAIGAYISISFAFLGYFLGYIREAHGKMSIQAHTIQEQYRALYASQKRFAEHEKLAALGQMAACVAHEVRNPLGVIRTSTQMLMDDLLEADDRFRAGSFICEEVSRLDSFCKALLQYARPIALHLRVTSMHSVLTRLKDTFQALHPDSQWTLRWELSSADVEVQLDVHLFEQALLSLLENAAEAIQKDGHIQVSMNLPEEDEASVWIEITDDGEGISKEDALRIFEPFFTTKSIGTGLGLAMSVRLIEAHSGTLTYHAQQGLGELRSGACFRIILPREVKR